jgi:hypothetical protein
VWWWVRAVVVASEREWNGKTKVEWPERAAGLLQAQPLSEPSLGRNRGCSSHVQTPSPGTCTFTLRESSTALSSVSRSSSYRKSHHCASPRPIGNISRHILRHSCNLPLLLRALRLPRPTISLEYSPCNGRAAVQQTPTMLLQPSTPSLGALSHRVT